MALILLYVIYVFVYVVPLFSPVVEIWIILPGMFCTRDKNVYTLSVLNFGPD